MQLLKPQKVLHLKDELKKKKPKLDGNFLITEKYDGWYVEIYYNDTTQSWGYPISSSGRTIPALMWTQRLFNLLPKPKEDCKLIAEAYIPELPFYKTNGLLNRSVGNCDCLDVEFVFHDLIYLNKQYVPALDRWIELQKLDMSFSEVINTFRKVDLIVLAAYNPNLWEDIFEKIILKGGEGIIAKHEQGVYSPGKRNANLLKHKLEITKDLLATSIIESYGDKGNFGLTLVSIDSNGVETKTIIGNHELRGKILSDPSYIIGKVVEVKAMEEYPDGVLRQPVFKCIREDKLPEDID